MGCCKCEEYGWKDDPPQAVVWTDLTDGEPYCLFHAPKEHKGVSDREFERRVFERVKDGLAGKLSADGSPIVVFSGTVFPCPITFHGRLPRIFFEYANFTEGVSFREVEFPWGADFSDAIFMAKADFSHSHFLKFDLGNVSFCRSRFDCCADFEHVTFKSNVEFGRAIFSEHANFDFAIFEGECTFMGTKFNGILALQASKFKEGALFNHSVFNAAVYFHFASSEKALTICYCTAQNKSFKFHNVDRKLLEQLNFNASDLSEYSFSCCDWPQKLYSEKSLNISSDYHLKNAELYRAMKRRATEEHDQPLVSRWHFREKLMQLKQMFNNDRSNDLLEAVEDADSPWLKRAKAWLLLLWHRPLWPKLTFTGLYWATSGFGERYIRAGVWLVILALLPFIFSYSPIASGLSLLWAHVPGAQCVNVVIDYLSTSVNATTAMQYIPFTNDIGGKEASGWLKVGQGLWQCLIILQFTLFALAVRNHFRR